MSDISSPLPPSDLHQRLRTAANVREDYALRQFREAQLLRQAVDELETARRTIATLRQQVRTLCQAWLLAQAERDRCQALLRDLGVEVDVEGAEIDLEGIVDGADQGLTS